MSAHEVVIDADGIPLSGLLAEPAERAPRAVVLAIPGSGMSSRYFHGPVDPEGSLLDLGACAGFTVWSIDRPGYGTSVDIPDDRLDIFGQADLVHAALATFARDHDIGAGFFVVAHSYGLKLALVMAAASTDGRQLLGIDGAGTGLRYAIDPRRPPPQPRPRPAGDRGPMWGPDHLYPAGTFARGGLPFAPVPRVQSSEAAAWPAVLRSIAADVEIPVRFTYGDHERLWPIGDAELADLRALFTAAPRVETVILPGSGHNVSLSNAAPEYHRRALAFASDCIPGAHAQDESAPVMP